MSTTIGALLTAEEYAELPDDGRPTELVRGVVVPTRFRFPRHGEICAQVSSLLMQYLETHRFGRAVCNGAAVITERNPDTVRGPDISYYSYSRMPRGRLPDGYLPVTPELVIEVRPREERWGRTYTTAAEFLCAGVILVCVLDQQTQKAFAFHADQPPREVKRNEELTLPEVFPGFRVPVRRFFE